MASRIWRVLCAIDMYEKIDSDRRDVPEVALDVSEGELSSEDPRRPKDGVGGGEGNASKICPFSEEKKDTSEREAVVSKKIARARGSMRNDSEGGHKSWGIGVSPASSGGLACAGGKFSEEVRGSDRAKSLMGSVGRKVSSSAFDLTAPGITHKCLSRG